VAFHLGAALERFALAIFFGVESSALEYHDFDVPDVFFLYPVA